VVTLERSKRVDTVIVKNTSPSIIRILSLPT
jgi:hypothetical protein